MVEEQIMYSTARGISACGIFVLFHEGMGHSRHPLLVVHCILRNYAIKVSSEKSIYSFLPYASTYSVRKLFRW